jgi:hypothetical protein
VTGGDPSGHDWESLDVRWFAPEALPRRRSPFCEGQIEDALADTDVPVEKEQRLPRWQAMLLIGFFALRQVRNRLLRLPGYDRAQTRRERPGHSRG